MTKTIIAFLFEGDLDYETISAAVIKAAGRPYEKRFGDALTINPSTKEHWQKLGTHIGLALSLPPNQNGWPDYVHPIRDKLKRLGGSHD